MQQSWKWVSAIALMSTGLPACQGDQQQNQNTTPILSVSTAATAIDDKGQSTEVRISAFAADGTTGTGTVELTAGAGSFQNGEKTLSVQLASGKATATFQCSAASDSACAGRVALEGRWSGVVARNTVQVGSSSTSQPMDGGSTSPTDGGSTSPADGGSTAPADAGVPAGPPANILAVAAEDNPMLGLRSSGRSVSTRVQFQVVALNGRGVAGAAVDFAVAGAGGTSVTPATATTNDSGLAATVLQAGDEVGMATVIASAAGFTASSAGIPVVGARPSDEGFQVQCVDINLAANASATPPRADLTTSCLSKLVDRYENPVLLATNVSWFAEAGSVTSPVLSDAQDGVAATTFSTFGKWPPADVAPLTAAGEPSVAVGEPFATERNPRDMLVTVIAVTSGEEEFYDGSGLSNGVKDGKWNPGEWFVDVAEPFIDENDNQQYDPGEPFIDTERFNCETQQREPKNGKWDPPNGCWDSDVQLWRPTHIVYSGIPSVINISPELPSFLAAKSSSLHDVRISDDYFNVLSPDSAEMNAMLTGDRGSAELLFTDGRLNTRYYGFTIRHERVATAPSAASPVGYTVTGMCNPSQAAPAGAATDPKLARCVRQYAFGDFTGGNRATLQLKGAPEAAPPPAKAFVVIEAGNSYGKTQFIRGPIDVE
jgi:hypothetical protein